VYQQVKEAVLVWFVSQVKLIAQWTKCIENKGGCMENNAIVET
jgi:hypothetical protein